jgi:hypothetical protein
MRAFASIGFVTALSALMLAACGGEDAASPLIAATPEASGPMENVAEAGAADVAFVLGCGAPFTPDATPATLAAAFGRDNVVPETIDGPEGEQLNVTAIFPNDPERRIEVTFANEEERTGLTSVTVRDHASKWKARGGYTFGDGIEAVEAANGGPFAISGFAWDYGGYVSDWKDGLLGGKGVCRTTVRFVPAGAGIPDSIVGDGISLLSSDPAVRAVAPTVSLFGISYPGSHDGSQ